MIGSLSVAFQISASQRSVALQIPNSKFEIPDSSRIPNSKFQLPNEALPFKFQIPNSRFQIPLEFQIPNSKFEIVIGGSCA